MSKHFVRPDEHPHAILTDNELVFMEAGKVKRVQIAPIVCTDDMLNWCVTYKISTLWVQPGCSHARWPINNKAASNWDIRPGDIQIGREKFYKTISARDGKTWITITWPEFSYEWHEKAFPVQPGPVDMLACLDYMSRAFDVPVHHNPGVMGRSLMERYNDTKRRAEWIERPDFDFDTLPSWRGEGFTYQAGVDEPEEWLASWKRHHQPGRVFLHSWDRNSQYPDAAAKVYVGCGKPAFICPDGTFPLEQYVQKRPTGKGWIVPAGYWKVGSDVGKGSWDNQFFAEMNPIEPGQTWVTTPMLQLLLNEGIKFSVDTAYIYPERHIVLDKFGPNFWQARQQLKNPASYKHAIGREMAYYSAKRVGAASVGLLNSQLTKKYNLDMYRPDWWRFIIEQAKVLMYFNMQKVYKLSGEMPLMVATDAVYYLSIEENPELAFPGCFTKPDELGGWKYGFKNGPIEVTPDVLACFNPTFSPGKTIVQLRRFQ